MSYYIRLEDEDLKFLQGLVSRSVQRLKGPGEVSVLVDVSENLSRIDDALFSAMTAIQTLRFLQADDQHEELAPTKKKRTPKTPTTGIELCSTHKNYTAKRAPRTDCEICWGKYKDFNPLTYKKARDKWERANQKR